MSTEGKITKGEDLGGLFSTPSSSLIIVETDKYGKLEFEVRPMNNDVYAKMGAAMNTNNVNTNKIEGLASLKVFSEVYYPAIKVVFPYCCINPKVIDGKSSDKSVIDVTEMPMDICMDLFAQIMDISGLSAKADEEIKK